MHLHISQGSGNFLKKVGFLKYKCDADEIGIGDKGTKRAAQTETLGSNMFKFKATHTF